MDKHEYNFDRLTVPEPEPVAEQKTGWLWTVAHIAVLIFALFVGIVGGIAGINAIFHGSVAWGVCETACAIIIVWMAYIDHGICTEVVLSVTLLLCLIGTWTFECKPAVHPAEMTYPEAGPSAVFGQTIMPEPVVCPACTCPDCSFLARFVGALDDAGATPREIRDVLHRCYTESRFSAGAVSSTGDYGICQINAGAHPETDVDRLLTDPVYAAGECLRVYRGIYSACGADWQCCYRYGVRGCKGRVTAAGGVR